MRLRWVAHQAAARAHAVVTISEFSRRELIEHLDVSDERIRVIPPGIEAPRVNRAALRTDARVLFVGSIFNRRHVSDLIRAFAPLARAHADASLEIVGDNRSYPHEDVDRAIAAQQLAGQIRWHHYVPEEQLRGLYGCARAFAFLSEYEGLGLTPLEALAAGVPPVLRSTA